METNKTTGFVFSSILSLVCLEKACVDCKISLMCDLLTGFETLVDSTAAMKRAIFDWKVLLYKF